MKTFENTLALINNTPLIELDRITFEYGKIFAKAEFVQLGGSIKDRAALQIVRDAYEKGSLKKGQPVVEMTSGNMGAGLAIVCRQFGNPFTAVMSKGNSPERRKILKALGADIVLTDQVDGKPGMVTGKDIQYAASVAKRFSQDINGFYVDQFNNHSSVAAHFNTTGPEIASGLPDLDVFISCVGSGGTFIGTSRFLKSMDRQILCIAVEPENAALLKTGRVNDPNHIIQGTGYGIVPPHWDPFLADDIITVSDEEVIETTHLLAQEQSLYVGYSSGANVAAALKFLKQAKKDYRVATILCDTAYKYSEL